MYTIIKYRSLCRDFGDVLCRVEHKDKNALTLAEWLSVTTPRNLRCTIVSVGGGGGDPSEIDKLGV